MNASITFQGGGVFATTITDQTAGWTVNTPMKFGTGYIPQSGEAILEDVLGQTGAPLGGAPQFTPAVTINNFTYTTGGTAIPLAGAPSLLENVVVERNNSQPFKVSGLTGGTFTFTWQGF
jgi:hypothetical protein